MNSLTAIYTPQEMMTIAAARALRNDAVCFVGVGLPSVAACVARQTHAPDVKLVYESGAIDAKPSRPPFSIADPDLAESAAILVSVPEMFSYWLQGGHVDIGVLGTAQIDRFGNLNTTVIGAYDSPKVRFPGAGGAPHIAENVRHVVVIVKHDRKAFVSELDFLTTPRCAGRTTVVTDMGILEFDEDLGELTLIAVHPGTDAAHVCGATGWPLRVSPELRVTEEPSSHELAILRNVLE